MNTLSVHNLFITSKKISLEFFLPVCYNMWQLGKNGLPFKERQYRL